MIWSGVFTALVTPFTKDGNGVDYQCLEKLIQKQIDGGTSGIVIMGTTGEAPTCTFEEEGEILEIALKMAKGRVKIVSGMNGNVTKDTVANMHSISDRDIDGIMITCPFYNKPSQNGIIAHYSALASETDLPVMIYNVPGRSGMNISVSTMAKLHEMHPHICGLKEASGSYDQIAEAVRVLSGSPFQVMAGDDSMVLPTMALGGTGVVSVLSNLYPEIVASIVDALKNNDLATASKIYLQYMPLMKGIFIGGNPAGIKGLMSEQGLLNNTFRLPIVPQTPEEKAQLLQIHSDVISKR